MWWEGLCLCLTSCRRSFWLLQVLTRCPNSRPSVHPSLCPVSSSSIRRSPSHPRKLLADPEGLPSSSSVCGRSWETNTWVLGRSRVDGTWLWAADFVHNSPSLPVSSKFTIWLFFIFPFLSSWTFTAPPQQPENLTLHQLPCFSYKYEPYICEPPPSVAKISSPLLKRP